MCAGYPEMHWSDYICVWSFQTFFEVSSFTQMDERMLDSSARGKLGHLGFLVSFKWERHFSKAENDQICEVGVKNLYVTLYISGVDVCICKPWNVFKLLGLNCVWIETHLWVPKITHKSFCTFVNLSFHVTHICDNSESNFSPYICLNALLQSYNGQNVTHYYISLLQELNLDLWPLAVFAHHRLPGASS